MKRFLTQNFRAGSPARSARARARRIVLAVASLACGEFAQAQNEAAPAPPPPESGSNTNIVKMETVTVVGKLDDAREQIVPNLGASSYSINQSQIAAMPQGENAGFNQVLLRAPGVAEDSLGGLHVRGEHANLQYRINDVLLPEGITGFGQELDTRYVSSVQLVTGSLPAQYGFRTAGIVDLHTKSGAFAQGGDVSVYGGSYDTLVPSVGYGGSAGNLNYFVDGSYDHNGIGVENPTPSSRPIHDYSNSYKTFTYLSYVLDDTSRISVIGSATYTTFEIPNTPGLANDPANVFAPGGAPGLPATFDSSTLNERQIEQNYYGVVAYQKSVGDLNLQVAAFGRSSSAHFRPDIIGDLFFNGVASDVDRTIYSGGMQADASYGLGEKHTLRGGLIVLDESSPVRTTTTAFPIETDPGNPNFGNPNGFPRAIVDNYNLNALFYGAYLQDEWKIVPKLTLNFGVRFDGFDSFVDENQASPRVNLIYQPAEATTLHAGYARYFTPPALEAANAPTVARFIGTSNETEVKLDDSPKAERSHYFDAGVTQKLFAGMQVGLDGYYKRAKNQLDDGLFGASLIPSQFNYRDGEVYGIEFTASYTHEGFSTYANVAWSQARGKDVVSGQFLFGQDDLNYIKDHWVWLDHDQRVTGSFGASYLWKHDAGTTRPYVDALYGSGLRTDLTQADGSVVPNGGSAGPYYSVSVGCEEAFKIHGKEHLKARLDVVNITDNIYQLRDGSGIGVNASQYGMRLGFFGTLTYLF